MLLAPGTPDLTRSDTHFISKYGALLDIALRAGDLVIVVVTACMVSWARFGSPNLPPAYLTGVVLAVLLTLLVFPAAGVYRSWRGQGLTMEVTRVCAAWTVVTAALLALGWLLKSESDYSRIWVVSWYALVIALFVAHRMAARGFLGFVRARGLDTRRVVLVGSTRSGARMLDAVRNNPWMGLEIIGYVETPYDDADIHDLPRLGSVEHYISSRAAIGAHDQLWIALPLRAEKCIRELNEAVGDASVSVCLIPDMFGHQLLNQCVSALAGVPVLTLRSGGIEGHARVAKAIEDRLLAIVILLLISPLMLLVAAAIKLTSPGPVFYKQKRHGLGSREIEVWKFRSMRVSQDDKFVQATRNDSRVTRIGRFLRASSLDELPQFINVLQGRMSIVGPRPHPLELNYQYMTRVQQYMQRHHVKPGITGLAQVSGCRGETDTIDKMERRIEFDLMYIRNWSLGLDLKIVILTIVRGFFGKNAY